MTALSRFLVLLEMAVPAIKAYTDRIASTGLRREA